MKYYIIISILLLIAIRGVGQEPDHCSEVVIEEPTEEVWDWRLESSFENVLVRDRDNEEPYILYPLYNPFFDQFSNLNTNHLQPNSNAVTPDFEPNESWEFVYKNFGRFTGSGDEIPVEDPTFVLYNRYRGTLRVFVYARTYFEANKAKIRLSLLKDDAELSVMSGALTNGKPVARALDNFDKSITMDAINHYNTDGNYWLFADFPIAYDPCVCANNVIFEIFPQLLNEIDVNLEYGNSGASSSSSVPNDLNAFMNNFDATIGNLGTLHKEGQTSFKNLNNFITFFTKVINGGTTYKI